MEVLNNSISPKLRIADNIDIALTRDTIDFDRLTQENLVIDVCVTILIEEGKASLTISGEVCNVNAGEILFINAGQNITDVMVSANLQFRAIFQTVDESFSLASRINLNWKMRSGMMLTKYFKSSVNDNEMRTIILYYDLLEAKRIKTPHQRQEVEALHCALGLYLIDIIANHKGATTAESEPANTEYNICEQHFNRFMQLLLDSPQIERKVSSYATQLCITSKYLNIICHKTVGLTPSEIIDREIVQRATHLLHANVLSIKEIAQKLGFCNQSHFGTFMKRLTGKSPQQLRQG